MKSHARAHYWASPTVTSGAVRSSFLVDTTTTSSEQWHAPVGYVFMRTVYQTKLL
jgi:hypothetical protein